MEAFLLIARLILAAVFGVAGIAKFADREGSEKAIVNFGLPESLAKPLTVLLPLAEIVTAILLLPLATAWFGAIAATALLLAFVAGIIYNMARGNAPDCHCFGQLHSEPIGWSVLIRNLLLTTIAVFTVAAGRIDAGASAFAWFGELTTGERIQFVFNLIFVGFFIVIFFGIRNVFKTQLMFQRQLEILELTANENGARREIEREDARRPSPGLPIGAIAQDFAAMDLDGRQITLEHLLMLGKPILLFFVSPTCNPCKALLPSIEGWQAEFGTKLTMVLVSSGAVAENRQKYEQVADFATILLQKEREISRMFRSEWTPSAVLINTDAIIGSVLATGDSEIFGLMDKIKPILMAAIAANGNGHAPQNIFVQPQKDAHIPVIGQTVPDFTLPNLDGKNISLSAFRGMKTVLLFWRATCPYCQQLTERLKAWEKANNEFNLVILAANEPEMEQAREFKSTVLIETNLEVQRIFDFDGTPSAVVISEDGKIISDLAGGEEDVFALIG
ncbi:MAG: MauE/DoxX family redox-associated membrane protein, partial [Pyrinomonadaceae bacterium]